MAYDSKTYGQSPFGGPKKTGRTKAGDGKAAENKLPETKPLIDDELDKGLNTPVGLASKFPTIPVAKPEATTDQKSSTTSTRKSRTNSSKSTSKSPATSSNRKGKKTKATETAAAEIEAADAAVAKRFFEEDRKAYLSLLYKTGISGLIWAVLRLVRHELSQETVAVINTLIDPVMIATITLIGVLALTFWMRSLLKDIALHTQKLYADAELTEGKNYRPTLEIVGDSLEYNPKLRKNLASFYNIASILICSLISYLVTFALFPTE